MPAHHPSRNPSAQRSRSQQLTHANGNGNGHGRANGNAAGSIEQTIAGGVAVLTPRFVRCGTFVFNLDHVVSLKFSDADVSVQLSDGAVAMIQDARAAATLLRLLQCGDDVLDITPPPANGESLGLITFARYGTRLDVRVEHERITPAAGSTNGAHPPTNGKRVAKIRPGKVQVSSRRRHFKGFGPRPRIKSLGLVHNVPSDAATIFTAIIRDPLLQIGELRRVLRVEEVRSRDQRRGADRLGRVQNVRRRHDVTPFLVSSAGAAQKTRRRSTSYTRKNWRSRHGR
jgi:hypothetical protein